MEEPVKKKIKLGGTACIICNEIPHEYSENKGRYRDLLIHHLIPPLEKYRFFNKNIFHLCFMCLDVLDELFELQLSLDFITKSIRKKENEFKSKIILNRQNFPIEHKVVKSFRDVATRSFYPKVKMWKDNSLLLKPWYKKKKETISNTNTVKSHPCSISKVAKWENRNMDGRRISGPLSRTVNRKYKGSLTDKKYTDIHVGTRRRTSDSLKDTNYTARRKSNSQINNIGNHPSSRRSSDPVNASSNHAIKRKIIGQFKTEMKLTPNRKLSDSSLTDNSYTTESSKLSGQSSSEIVYARKSYPTPLQTEKKMPMFGKTQSEFFKVKYKLPLHDVKSLVKCEPRQEQHNAFRSDGDLLRTAAASSNVLPSSNNFTAIDNNGLGGGSSLINATEAAMEPMSGEKTWSKPPLTYVQLCVLAVMSQESVSMIVREIYSFCKENFPYFRELKNNVWENQIRNALRTPFFYECPQRRFEEPFTKSGLKVFSVVEKEITRLRSTIDKMLSSQSVLPSMAFPERLPSFKTCIQKELPPGVSDDIPRKTIKPKIPKSAKKTAENIEGKSAKQSTDGPNEEQKEPPDKPPSKKPRKPPGKPASKSKKPNAISPIDPSLHPAEVSRSVANALPIGDELQYTPNGAIYHESKEPSTATVYSEVHQPSNELVYNPLKEMANGAAFFDMKAPTYDNTLDKTLPNGYIAPIQQKELSYDSSIAYTPDPSAVASNSTQIISCVPFNEYDKPTLSYEELCVVAIMNVESMLVSASDVYDFVIENFPSFYNPDVYSHLPCKNFIKSVLGQSSFYFYATWTDVNFIESLSPGIGQTGCLDVYQMLYTIIYNYPPHFRKIIASKLSSKENMALMAFRDRVYAFIQNVLEKPIVPDFNHYIHHKMQNKMINMEPAGPPMVDSNQWVQPPAFTNTDFYNPYTLPNSVFPSSSTML